MKKTLIIFLGALFVSCSTAKETSENLQDIDNKIATYRQLSSKNHPKGYIYPDDCDSLVFTGLYGGSGGKVDIRDYHAGSGLFLRRPVSLPDCFEVDKSASQCSRDTYLSVFVYLWFADWVDKAIRLDLARQIWSRGIENDWIMCEGIWTRTKLSKGMIGTLAWIIHRLGGEDHSERTNPLYTIVPTGTETGFERHLSANHIYLRAELTGRMPVGIGLILSKYIDSQPQNPLFHAIFHRYEDGIQSKAISLLLDEKHWPNDHCPTSSNHCAPWVIQRDSGKDWRPCPEENHQHSCASFLWSVDAIVR